MRVSMDNDISKPNTIIVQISAEAFLTAQRLEERCTRSGLDWFDQALIHLIESNSDPEIALWQQVWEYVQTLECASNFDRVLVDLI